MTVEAGPEPPKPLNLRESNYQKLKSFCDTPGRFCHFFCRGLPWCTPPPWRMAEMAQCAAGAPLVFTDARDFALPGTRPTCVEGILASPHPAWRWTRNTYSGAYLRSSERPAAA